MWKFAWITFVESNDVEHSLVRLFPIPMRSTPTVLRRRRNQRGKKIYLKRTIQKEKKKRLGRSLEL